MTYLRFVRMVGLLSATLLIASCSNHRVTTALEWCGQLTGVDLQQRTAPFYSIFPGISFDGDSIRSDFVSFLDAPMLEAVGHRAEHMAWREGTNLQLENLSTLMRIAPDSIIAGWRRGIARANSGNEIDGADRCLFGSVVSLFDTVTIHTGIWDAGHFALIKDSLTIIPTNRRVRLHNPI